MLSRKERRYRCKSCGQTFSPTKGTPFYRLHKAADVVTLVLTPLCQGYPIQAIVAAFGFDERTIASWQLRAGQHRQRLHEHLVQQGQVDLQHFQADELWVKMVGKRVRMAMAVPCRLRLGGAISVHRDLALVSKLVQMVRALSPAIPVCVDGLSSYVTAFRCVFRRPVRTDRRGRPRLVLEKGLLLGQVVKQYAQRRTAEAITTNGGKDINTAYIERLHATFRSALVRCGRAIAYKEAMLTAGMYLVGCAYNFCWYHGSLRPAAAEGASQKWLERTPAMSAGLADHRWICSNC